jgi:hypothetical protein
MLSYVRYTVIAMSVVFLLATSVTAAMSPPNTPFMNVQRSTTTPPKPEPINSDAENAPQRSPVEPQPHLSGPTFSEPVAPSESAPIGTLPTAVPPDPAKPPQEINPRQNPAEKK